MKGRWLPFLATTACLALAAASPAQDRGRRGGGGSDRSSDRSSRSGGGDSRPARRDDRSSREDRSQREDRPARRYDGPTRSSGDARPERPSRTDRSGQSSGSFGGWNGGDRPAGNRPTHNEPPVNSGDQNTLPSRAGNGETRNDRSDRPSRRNPFDPQGRTGDARPSGDRGSWGRNDRGSNDRPVFGGDRADRIRPSRSGNVSYGTYYNGYGNLRATRYSGGFHHAEIGRNIRRDRPSGVSFAFGGVYGGLRYGYVGYNSSWRDDNFCYPFYVFDPWAPNVAFVASPWYRYSYLPPYLNSSRVVVVNNYYSNWGYTDDWRDYDYRADDRARRNEEIDSALDDIRDSFERNSDRYAERLIPTTGQVAIFNEGRYDYSLGADDFQDMFVDGILQSKTSRYDIIESRVKGDELHLRARHEYTDSWGATQVVFHTYTLRREQGGRYVIREFGTD